MIDENSLVTKDGSSTTLSQKQIAVNNTFDSISVDKAGIIMCSVK